MTNEQRDTVQALVDALEYMLPDSPDQRAVKTRALEAGRALLAQPQEAQEPVLHIKCETTDGVVTGTTGLNVIRVEANEDGSFTAVTDHWPAQPPADGWVCVPREPTEDMLTAYLTANDAYWRRTDQLPAKNPSKWRQGTPSEATAESYRAMLAAAPQPPAREPMTGETDEQRLEVTAAWNDLPEALRCHPGLKRLYRALGGITGGKS